MTGGWGWGDERREKGVWDRLREQGPERHHNKQTQLKRSGSPKTQKEVKPIYITEEQFHQLLLVSHFAPSGPAEYDRQMRRGGEKGEQRREEKTRGDERRGEQRRKRGAENGKGEEKRREESRGEVVGNEVMGRRKNDELRSRGAEMK